MSARIAAERRGHLLALFTIIVWGTTFLSTTVLLRDFSPYEILFIRMLLGIAALTAARPRLLRLQSKKHEWYFAGAGLFGVTLYFLLENFALTYTYSANCSVIISTAPFFVASAMRLFGGGEKMNRWFFVGFAAAIAGIALISFSGQALHLNPLGDVLCLLAAVSWAGYSVMLRKLEPFGYDTLLVTRRVFSYGLFFLICALPFLPFAPSMEKLLKPVNLFNFLYLGLCASALCFVTWSVATHAIGTVKTSVYIYLSPVVTIVAARLLLNDPVLPMALAGTVLALAGLVISQFGSRREAIVNSNDA
ncbi:MAG: DMT family transporter [Eubacteriales bacterium]|nr:DMT family transporter [Eubacteriales bacterium]